MQARNATVCIGLLLGLSLAVAGCGGPAKAEPLEVTYYYLPG